MTAQAERSLLEDVPSGLFIGGEWRPSATGRSFSVDDPATGEALAEVADGNADDAAAAMDAAVEAAASWARTPARQRSDILRRTFDAVRARTDDFALLMTLEMGKPLAEAKGEVTYGNEFLRWFSEEAVRIEGRFGPNPEGTGRMIVSRHPVGPCHLITPWNFPLAMATRKVGPALAAGCTAVIKPADLTPLTTLLLTSVLAEAGLPPGVLNVVTTTDAASVSGTVIADPRLRKLSFTGSTPVGRRLLAQSAEGVLRTSMELGGNAPFVVFADADVDLAVEGAMLAKFRNIGEACTAANRFIVAAEVAEEFTAKVSERVAAMRVGRGTEEGVQVGPLINEKAREKAGSLVSDAVGRGAEVVVGGHAVDGPGTFYEPTVVAGVRPGSRILAEEIFGPVLAVATFADEEEGVALANDTEYGLVGYAYTQDLARAMRLVDALETGMVGINTGVVSNAAAPFGGVKQSGLGREGGREGIGEYLETRYTLIPDPWA
ncbi:succinate semialdehyde dehydrogenase [Microlunatus sagamiharensis]|uniref:Succinate semialdehyde dehydrogenase n=1 Tax=Microlunatus sagamiharensis TaxID=546874 RepID=A0A1H2N0Q4_9ACTN|nr:NAD-dependent succinate-semialdehyde dehydrogenase [Microlunatus sagamiharensis]SDU99117.1 succinate semialdehyde dehydrogenase [Microlunatus sagamiharensis]